MVDFEMYVDGVEITVSKVEKFGKSRVELALIDECNTYGEYERLYARMDRQEVEKLIEVLQKALVEL